MQLRQYYDPDGFPALQPEWNGLLRRSSANTVFSTWEWQSTWWRYLSAGDLWLSAIHDASRLVAIFPCYRRTRASGERSIHLIGCVEVADYLDLIIEKGRESTAYEGFLDALSDDGAPAWDTVELCNVPATSPTYSMLPEMAQARGFGAQVVEEDVCPLIELPGTWEEYLSSIDKKQRHEIRRKLRRARGSEALEWYVVGEEHDLRQEIEIFLDLHRRSTVDKSDFMDEDMVRFFHGIGEAMQRAGWLQLMQLKMGGAPAASLMSFDYEDSIMLYNSGYDPENHSHLSPGIVLIALAIKHAIELNRGVFDFLQGDEEYKYRFGAHDTRVYRVILQPGA